MEWGKENIKNPACVRNKQKVISLFSNALTRVHAALTCRHDRGVAQPLARKHALARKDALPPPSPPHRKNLPLHPGALMTSNPPMNGRSTGGTTTLPSAC